VNGAKRWALEHVEAVGPADLVHEKPWSRVWRVPLAGGDAAWLKACAPVQRFEPILTWSLQRRWPNRVVDVLAHDNEHAWMLLGDGGTPVGAFGNAPDAWAVALPLYAELQRGEVEHTAEHLATGVTDRRLGLLPGLYEDMLGRDLPLDPEEVDALRRFAPEFAHLCGDLAAAGIPDTVQHDDLHLGNVYAKDGRIRVLDWGDTSIAHPFFSLARGPDVWPDELRAAYLEPWGGGLEETLALALRVGAFAYAFGFLRLWDHLTEKQRPAYADAFPMILRRAYERCVSAFSSTSTRRGFEPS
jgi:hypothetical protein